jgi:hypothetical protein
MKIILLTLLAFVILALIVRIITFVYDFQEKNSLIKRLKSKFRPWQEGDLLLCQAFDNCGHKAETFLGMVKDVTLIPDYHNKEIVNNGCRVTLYNMTENIDYVVYPQSSFFDGEHNFINKTQYEEISTGRNNLFFLDVKHFVIKERVK